MRKTPTALAFSRGEAHQAGWTDSALARAVNAERLHRIRAGWFATPERVADPRTLALAATRVCSGSVISHASAAVWHGLPLLRRPELPTVTVPPRGTGDLAGAHLHRATLAATDVVDAGGVRVTSVARTLVDLARHTTTAAAVVPIDAALHRRLTTHAELDDVLRRCATWPGIRRAMRAIRLADARAESPLESISRLVLGWLRWPPAVLQQRIGGPTGQFIGRLDFYWDELGVGGEADGAAKYDNAALYNEKRRQDELEDTRLVIVRWGWSDVTRAPRRLAARLDAAAVRAAALERSGFPRNWSLLPSLTDH